MALGHPRKCDGVLRERVEGGTPRGCHPCRTSMWARHLWPKEDSDRVGEPRHRCRAQRHPLHAQEEFRITTDSKHQLPIAENLLNRQFTPTAPNRVWVADITYIPTNEGWLFLAAIKDLYTCEIVGWAMDKQMTKQLVIDALRAAYWRKKPKAGLMHHSDRGRQYCSQLIAHCRSAMACRHDEPQR
jgi:transposase InsO family protein